MKPPGAFKTVPDYCHLTAFHDELVGCMQNGVLEGGDVIPRPVEVSPDKGAPGVAQEHPVRVHHGHHLEHDLVADLLGDPMVAGQELHHALDDERRGRVAGVRPGQHDHQVLAVDVALHVVRDGHQGGVQPMLKNRQDILPWCSFVY